MNTTTITYYKDYYNKKKFVFCFKNLDDYEVIVQTDKNNMLCSGFDGIAEITRLLNAANLFRQWARSQRYNADELRHAIEEISKKNEKENVLFKEYRFAVLGTKQKSFDKILVEKP